MIGLNTIFSINQFSPKHPTHSSYDSSHGNKTEIQYTYKCFGSHFVNVKDTVSGLTFIYPRTLVVRSPSIVSLMPHFSDGECGVIRQDDKIRAQNQNKFQFELNSNSRHPHTCTCICSWRSTKWHNMQCTRWLCRTQPRSHYFKLTDPHNDKN